MAVGDDYKMDILIYSGTLYADLLKLTEHYIYKYCGIPDGALIPKDLFWREFTEILLAIPGIPERISSSCKTREQVRIMLKSMLIALCESPAKKEYSSEQLDKEAEDIYQFRMLLTKQQQQNTNSLLIVLFVLVAVASIAIICS